MYHTGNKKYGTITSTLDYSASKYPVEIIFDNDTQSARTFTLDGREYATHPVVLEVVAESTVALSHDKQFISVDTDIIPISAITRISENAIVILNNTTIPISSESYKLLYSQLFSTNTLD